MKTKNTNIQKIRNQEGGGGFFILNGSNMTDEEMSQFIVIALEDERTEVTHVLNNSLSGIGIILTISEELRLRTVNEILLANEGRIETIPVTRIFIKLATIHSKALDINRYVNPRSGVREGFGFMTEESSGPRGKGTSTRDEFIEEINIQNDIFRRSLIYNYPICPAILAGRIYSNRAMEDIFTLLLNRIRGGRDGEKANHYNRLDRYKNKILEFNQKIVEGRTGITDFGDEQMKLGLICMEFADGFNEQGYKSLNDILTDITEEVYENIKIKLLQSFYILFKTGYIHGDDHPGNVMVLRRGNDIEHIIFIDFGRTLRIQDEIENVDIRRRMLTEYNVYLRSCSLLVNTGTLRISEIHKINDFIRRIEDNIERNAFIPVQRIGEGLELVLHSNVVEIDRLAGADEENAVTTEQEVVEQDEPVAAAGAGAITPPIPIPVRARSRSPRDERDVVAVVRGNNRRIDVGVIAQGIMNAVVYLGNELYEKCLRPRRRRENRREVREQDEPVAAAGAGAITPPIPIPVRVRSRSPRR